MVPIKNLYNHHFEISKYIFTILKEFNIINELHFVIGNHTTEGNIDITYHR